MIGRQTHTCVRVHYHQRRLPVAVQKVFQNLWSVASDGSKERQRPLVPPPLPKHVVGACRIGKVTQIHRSEHSPGNRA